MSGYTGDDRRQIDMDKLDSRLRAVETALVQQTTAFTMWSKRLEYDDSKRRETCPHGEEFVVIMEALKTGGKRFQDIGDVITDIKKKDTELERRIDTIEDRLDNEKSWRAGAKWAFLALGGFLVWAGEHAWTFIAGRM